MISYLHPPPSLLYFLFTFPRAICLFTSIVPLGYSVHFISFSSILTTTITITSILFFSNFFYPTSSIPLSLSYLFHPLSIKILFLHEDIFTVTRSTCVTLPARHSCIGLLQSPLSPSPISKFVKAIHMIVCIKCIETSFIARYMFIWVITMIFLACLRLYLSLGAMR